MTRPTPRNLLPLAIIVLVAVTLRAHRLGAQSYWIDELLSLEASAGRGFADQELPLDTTVRPGRLTSLDAAPPPWRVWTTLRLDSHPPLYYVLLRLWRSIAGDDEAAVRSLSVVFSVGGVITLYFLARRITESDAAARWAAALAAVSALQVFHAQEARNTAMMTAATLLAALAALRAEERPTPRRFLALGAALVVAMLTHYLSAGALLAVAIYLAIRLRGRPLRDAAIAFATAAAVYAVLWGPWLWQQRSSLGRNHDAVSNPAAPAGFLAALGQAVVRAAADPLRQLTGSPAYESPLTAALIIAAFIASLHLLRPSPRLLLAHLWLAVPLLAMAAFDATTNASMLSVIRYTFVTAPAAFLLIAAAAPAVPKYLGHLLPLAAAVLAITSLSQTYAPWKPDWRTLAAELRTARAPAEPVVIATTPANRWWLGGAVLGLSHYSPATTDIPFLLLTEPSKSDSPPTAWVIAHTTPLPPHAYLPGSHPTSTAAVPVVGVIARVTR